MKLDIDISGKVRRIELLRAAGVSRWLIDGEPFEVDALAVSPGVYSILQHGKSIEVRMEPAAAGVRAIARGREYTVSIRDPREWGKNRNSAAEAQGRQAVLSPMPGKIVRVLVKTGDEVTAGMGLLVVEAMKMQNEIRTPKSGRIEKLTVTEGQTVNAGEVVAVVS
jgi:biotin carboxyl carrier protein